MAKKFDEIKKEDIENNKMSEFIFDLVNKSYEDKIKDFYNKDLYIKEHYISKNKIRELLDRFDLEEELQNYYDDLSGSEAVIKILKILLKGI